MKFVIEPGLVFVMWGGYAQKLRPEIEKINASTRSPIPIAFVENNHPAATGPALEAFHTNNSFTNIENALQSLGMTPIDFFGIHHAANAPIDKNAKRKREQPETGSSEEKSVKKDIESIPKQKKPRTAKSSKSKQTKPEKKPAKQNEAEKKPKKQPEKKASKKAKSARTKK